MFNSNNRQEIQVRIGAIAATGEYLAVVAGKKLRVLSAKVTDLGAQAASEADYLEYQLKQNTVAVGTKKDNKAGTAALAAFSVSLGTAGYIDMAKGDNLTLVVTKQGNGAGTDLLLSLDCEVIGN